MTKELFTVLPNECVACGAPELVAPDLMEQHGDLQEYWQCRFLRQPQTPNEFEQAIAAVNASCCGAVVYLGSDPEILARTERPPHSDAEWARPDADDWREAITIPDTGRSRPDFGELAVAYWILGVAGALGLSAVLWYAVAAKDISRDDLWVWLLLLLASLGVVRQVIWRR